MMLQPADVPGRAGTASPPAPAATADPGAAPAAPPSDGGGGLGGMGMMLLLPLVLFGIIILMNRGEKKRRAELETKLKKGDRVVTRAGITGKLVEVSERTVRVEIAPGVNVTMVKTAIEGLDTGEEAKAALPEKTSKDDKGGAKDDGKKKKK